MNFDYFYATWIGKRIDYDHVYGYQCVDLIKQGLYDMYGIGSGVSGNAIKYWTNPSPALIARFHKVDGSEAQKGDIVVLKTVGKSDYSGEGHIGWATGNLDATNVEILEQNGHGGIAPNTSGDGVGANLIRTRHVSRSRVAGLLRANPLPPPKPYSIETITSKQIQLNKDVNQWGLDYDNFTAIDSNPVGHGSAGEIKTVVAILHHNIGYNYYLEDANAARGWNIVDCNDYTPPAPAPIPEPTSQLPAGSIITQYQTEVLTVVSDMTGYLTANRAINRLSDAKTVVVPAGDYFIFNRYFAKGNQELLAVNISKTAGHAGAWISVVDNRIPTPEEVAAAAAEQEAALQAAAEAAAAQAEADRLAAEAAAKLPSFIEWYEPFEDTAKKYVAMRTVDVIDLEALHSNLTMPKYSVTYLTGFFKVAGIVYGRPKSAADKEWWYGIAMTDPETGLATMELESEVYDDKTTIEERQASGTLTTQDKWDLILGHLKDFWLAFIQMISKLKK